MSKFIILDLPNLMNSVESKLKRECLINLGSETR